MKILIDFKELCDVCYVLGVSISSRHQAGQYVVFDIYDTVSFLPFSVGHQVPRVPWWQCLADYEEEGRRGWAGQGVGADMMGNSAGDDADHKIATVAERHPASHHLQ